MNEARLKKLGPQLEAEELDCLALVPGANLTYLTGLHFHLGDRPTVAFFCAGRPPALVLPALELQKVAEMETLELFPWTDEDGYDAAFERAASAYELSGARIGVEAFTMRYVEASLLRTYALNCELVPADQVVGRLRMCKEPGEVAQMRRAAEMAQAALGAILPGLSPGMTEREIASQLKLQILAAGAENLSFEPIVSTGPNAANPHALPGERALHPGEFLLFDWGLYADGYASDITRTFPVGDMESEMREIYEVVKQANCAGRAAIRPGTTCSAVDAAARAVIEQAGHGEFFTHRTGHGLGMEIHEPPYIVAGNEQVLEVGMTFTIEPGIYLPGRNGVRIEDDVVVTEDGCESLTTMSRDWWPLA
jgi:Xaa-Pro dipeptidase